MGKQTRPRIARPPASTGYDEQISCHPKLKDKACRFCNHLEEKRKSKSVEWKSTTNGSKKPVHVREVGIIRAYCNYHNTEVDEFFGVCNFYE